MDGFDHDESGGQGDKRSEILGCLLATQGNTFETFEFSHCDFDPCPGFIESDREVLLPVFGIGLLGNDRHDVSASAQGPVGIAVIAFVADGGARLDVGTKIEKHREMRAITLLSASQIEGDDVAIRVGLEVDFGREPAARAPERLGFLPPFAPAAETCARTTVESNIWMRWADLLNDASVSKNISNTSEWLSRQNRFHTLFQLPYFSGNARHVTLCTAK